MSAVAALVPVPAVAQSAPPEVGTSPIDQHIEGWSEHERTPSGDPDGTLTLGPEALPGTRTIMSSMTTGTLRIQLSADPGIGTTLAILG